MSLITPLRSMLGVGAKPAVAHNFLTAVNADGSVSQGQPSYDDLASAPAEVWPGSLNGFLALSMDPAMIHNTQKQPAAATIHLAKIWVPKAITATNLVVVVTQAGTSYTNTQMGLYAADGTFLKATAVLASGGTNSFGSLGAVSVPLSASQAIAAGVFVWAAVHAGTNSATAFQIAATSSITNVANAGTTASLMRSGTQTGHATNPLATIGNLTPASGTQTGVPFFIAIT